MLYALAETLGMTVERILNEMTVTERNGWMLYFAERAEEREAAAEAGQAPNSITIGRGGRTTGNIAGLDPAEFNAAMEGIR